LMPLMRTMAAVAFVAGAFMVALFQRCASRRRL
jgi:hypothetical protein